MKTKILVIAYALMIIISGCRQSGKEVPANVKSAFNQKFANAAGVKWSMENKQEWEAEFKMAGKNYSANFDNAGLWVETEYEISMEEMPAEVKSTLAKESAGYKINTSEVAESKDGKVFEFILLKDKTETALSIDPNGNVLNKEQVKEEEEKEEIEEDN